MNIAPTGEARLAIDGRPERGRGGILQSQFVECETQVATHFRVLDLHTILVEAQASRHGPAGHPKIEGLFTRHVQLAVEGR